MDNAKRSSQVLRKQTLLQPNSLMIIKISPVYNLTTFQMFTPSRSISIALGEILVIWTYQMSLSKVMHKIISLIYIIKLDARYSNTAWSRSSSIRTSTSLLLLWSFWDWFSASLEMLWSMQSYSSLVLSSGSVVLHISHLWFLNIWTNKHHRQFNMWSLEWVLLVVFWQDI